ncbi:30S ribosomal protein S17 [Sulfurifustis variabilis]|uniref:Small ribosomal subunit protein uS17 n=1 Tax=Sulfurifustis variabilis TaxID=1675686 RepID=A0A1B4VGF1_9GAMM|nr:30S ribosomal protein S17 [Sulfurifustis variabilis]BAU49897.1 30S ribosomal protein S17 [Sulfurifustis variabilis]
MSDEANTTTTATARSLEGRVVSDKMHKTITVQVDRRLKHPLYGKYVTRRTKLHAHDENNECKEGDLVLIEPCRPLSKSKSWRLVKVLERARQV